MHTSSSALRLVLVLVLVLLAALTALLGTGDAQGTHNHLAPGPFPVRAPGAQPR